MTMPENNRMPCPVSPATRSALLRVLGVLVLFAVIMMGAAIWHALQARGLDVGSEKGAAHRAFLCADISVLCLPLAISIAGVIKFLLSLKRGGWRIPPSLTISESQSPHQHTRRLGIAFMVLAAVLPAVALLDQELAWAVAEGSVGFLSWGTSLWAIALVQEARVEVSRRIDAARDSEVKRPTSPEGEK